MKALVHIEAIRQLIRCHSPIVQSRELVLRTLRQAKTGPWSAESFVQRQNDAKDHSVRTSRGSYQPAAVSLDN
jgi:hypothetical protein